MKMFSFPSVLFLLTVFANADTPKLLEPIHSIHAFGTSWNVSEG